jgi:glycosyltransferase involved in cell wall biosynthesis
MKKLNYNAPICGTGYGLTSKHILKQICKYYNITLFPIGSIDTENDSELKSIVPLLDRNKEFDPNSPSLKIWHQFDLASRIGKGKYYAFPIFELDTFNKQEINHLQSCDHLFVCSEWAKTILLNNNINIPIDVIPLGTDPDIFDSETNNSKPILDKYIFLTIGKWEHRKSHDILIECFNQAFNANDNVELWLATYNPFLSKEELNSWMLLVSNSPLKDKIRVFNRLNSQRDIASLIQYSSCGVYISRAEGWNLELLETICMNKPVIATNYSGHTQFCNDQNAFLINITETEKAVDNKWFFGSGNWAKINSSHKDEIIQHMRQCYQNDIRSNPGYLSTKTEFTWENSAKTIVQCIN